MSRDMLAFAKIWKIAPEMSREVTKALFESRRLAVKHEIVDLSIIASHPTAYSPFAMDTCSGFQHAVLYYFDVVLDDMYAIHMHDRCRHCYKSELDHADLKCLWGPYSFEPLPDGGQ